MSKTLILTSFPFGKSIFLDLKLTALKKISRIDYESYIKLGTGTLVQRIENGASAGKSIIFDFVFV